MPIARPAAVIFDLDGTLLETLDDIVLALQKALRSHGFPALDRRSIARMVGDGARVLVARAVGRPIDDPVVAEVGRTFLAAYSADPTPMTRLVDGAEALLSALGARAIPVGVCTNKPGALARAIVGRMFGARIAVTIGGGDAERLKPDPAPVLATIRALGARGEIWFVGDGAQDVRAANAAGCTSIVLRQGYGTGADPSEARLVIDRLDELIGYLE